MTAVAAITRLVARTEPADLVEHTRRLFAVSVVFSLLAALTVPVIEGPGWRRLVIGSAALVLIGCWALRLRTRRDPFLVDVIEPVAVAVVMLVVPAAPVAYAFVFPAVWFRALYGSTARALRYCTVLSLAIVAVLALTAQVVTGAPALTGAALLLAPLPVLWLTAALAGALARTMVARERARSYDAALVRLGRCLIGQTDRERIYDIGEDCLRGICAATPGLAILILLRRGEQVEVHKHLGAGARIPQQGPAPPVLAGGAVSGRTFSAADLPDLRGVLGERAQWHSVVLTEEDGGWFLLGAPRAVPRDAVVAVQSQVNQVTLALRTCYVHDELRRLARVDPLTGLPNRTSFRERLDGDAGEGCGFALLFLDLDDFKRVNDEWGHAAGDELLVLVASRLCSALRPQDFCARLGGDEFAVLLPDAQDVAAVVAQRLVSGVSGTATVQGRRMDVGVSVGLAFSSPAVPPADLLKQADTAMYAAKAHGKNQVHVFDPAMLDEEGSARFEVDLAAAAAAGELEVHYQPIVSVSDWHCVAVEALVRWRHPSRGLLLPAEFIPAAERTGAINGIGTHVLRQACAGVARWLGPDGPLALHVNVSAVQLAEPLFGDVVRACAAECRRAGRQLVLEVTETMVLDSPVVAGVLDGFVELGATVAIDDFGTGYSALSTLRTLPVGLVKIDRSFLAGYPGEADVALVEAIVEVARRLRLQVVAEGVERPEQERFLRRIGAQAAQGHLYSRPVTAAAFACWLTHGDEPADAGPTGVDTVHHAVARPGAAQPIRHDRG